jgi:hypothetical protein
LPVERVRLRAGTTARNQPVPMIRMGIMSANPPPSFKTTAVAIQIAAQTMAEPHRYWTCPRLAVPLPDVVISCPFPLEP